MFYVYIKHSTVRACLERRNIKQRNGEKHRNRKEIHVYNRGKKNAGILEDLVFGTKEYKQHRNGYLAVYLHKSQEQKVSISVHEPWTS